MKAALFYGPSNNAITPTYVANAVNSVKVSGAVAGSPPAIAAMGSDNNITLNFQAKGSGSCNFLSPIFTTSTAIFTGQVSANGGLVVGNGNVAINTAGKTLTVRTGVNAKAGSVALAAGTATIANTAVSANSAILLTVTGPSANVGAPFIASVTVGVGFTITSTNAADTSTVSFVIVELL